MTATPDGTVWFASLAGSYIARIDDAEGTLTTLDVPVWVTDFATNALVRFDPTTERFASFEFPSAGAEVRQLLGRPGEVWGVGSATDTAIVLRTAR